MWFLLACVLPDDSAGVFACPEVAITDATGAPDPCDVAACERCVEGCGGDCLVLESYPPSYACDGGASWSVYDTCPNWQPPGSPHAADEESLGCGDGTEVPGLSATSPAPGEVEVTHIDALTGCCPQDLSVAVTASGTTLTVAYDLVEDLCECACALDLSYRLLEVPAGTWTLTAGPYADTTTVTVL